MKLGFVTFKDREDLLEGSRENFINTLDELREYISTGEFAFFVNIRGEHGNKNAPYPTYKQAYQYAEGVVAGGTPASNVFISCVRQEIATADDIDC